MKDTARKNQTQRLRAILETFGLKHVARNLPDILDSAEAGELSYRDFLLDTLEVEVNGRNERRRHRNYAGAHFPPACRAIDEFDPAELDSGITAGQIKKLKDLSWLDSHGNILLAGPPGLGYVKTAFM